MNLNHLNLVVTDLDAAGKLLRTPPANLAASDQKMSAALELWRDLPDTCRNDSALARVMTKAAE